MTPDKIRALRAVRDGGEIARHELEWLRKWGLVDDRNGLTTRGAEALTEADYDEENTGD